MIKEMNMMPGHMTSSACLEAASVLIDCSKGGCEMPLVPDEIRGAMMVCLRMVNDMCCCNSMGAPAREGCMTLMDQRMEMLRCEREGEVALELLREVNKSCREKMHSGCCIVMKKCKGIATYSGMSDCMMACEEEKEGEASLRKFMSTCGEKMRECAAEGIKRCAKSALQCDAPCLVSCAEALCCSVEQCDSLMISCNEGKRIVMPINIPAVPMHMPRTIH